MSLFILASVCKSLQCLISALTQAGEGGHLFRRTCSVVLLGGRDTANKYHWHVWGVLSVYGPHWVCPSSRRNVLQGALAPGCPGGVLSKAGRCFVHFPGLSCSGCRVLCKGTVLVGCAFCALLRSEQLRCLASVLSQVGCAS